MIKTAPINIAILDDHQIYCEGLQLILMAGLGLRDSDVSIYTSPDMFWANVETNTPDILLLDINMPKENGIVTCQRLKSAYPQVKVLIVSMSDMADKVSKAVKAGADGYMLKDCDSAELLTAISKVMRGEKYFDASVLNIMIGEFRSGKNDDANVEIASLTSLERNMLNLIAAEYTQEQIADKLKITHSNVIYTRRNLLSKFAVKNTAGLMRKAVMLNLIDI